MRAVARRFANWAGTETSAPTAWRTPASEDEVRDVVRAASGRRLRVVGGAHSWSRVAAPEDIAVSLDAVTGVVELDRERARVTVLAGTRLRDLNALLAEAGLALPIVGSIDAQSIGGLIATGTHGSSLAHGNMATLVTAMRLVTGRGETLDLAAPNPRLEGARVHLGALGVVTRATLSVVPAFRLAETIENVPIAGVPAELAAIAASAEYCKVWWMPHTRFAQVFRYERTDEPTSTRPSPSRQRWVDEKILHALVFPALLRAGRVRALVAPISRAVAKSFSRPRRVGPSTLMLSTPMPPRHRETEAAMPMDRAGEAVDRLVRAIERDGLRVNFPVEIRFVRGDSGWMSPAYGADTCQLGAYCFGPGSDAYFASFWREMRAIGARPHWGKELDHTVDEVRALWPLASKFAALRDELDPDRTFAGAFHTRTLGA
jgi:L-gulono-1,4-lactone dehydrogenase